MKSFEEALASVASQAPIQFQEFIKKEAQDGRETIAELNRDSLQLRTLITQNQTAEIVQAMRDMTTSLKDDKTFSDYISKGQLRFFGDELLTNLRKANEKVQNDVAIKLYERGVAGGLGNNNKDK